MERPMIEIKRANERTIKTLIEKGIIGKKKSVENLLKAVEKSKQNDIDKLLCR